MNVICMRMQANDADVGTQTWSGPVFPRFMDGKIRCVCFPQFLFCCFFSFSISKMLHQHAIDIRLMYSLSCIFFMVQMGWPVSISWKLCPQNEEQNTVVLILFPVALSKYITLRGEKKNKQI